MKLPSGLNENWRLVSSQLYEVLSVSVTERPRWLANLRETSLVRVIPRLLATSPIRWLRRR
jgi:hypothetical protein